MTNDEWCRVVLKKFFPPPTVDDSTIISPALAKITGEIWQDWHGIEPFARALPAIPLYGAPPDRTWILRVLGTAVWRRFTDDPFAVTPTVQARIRQRFGSRVQSAVSTGKDLDQI